MKTDAGGPEFRDDLQVTSSLPQQCKRRHKTAKSSPHAFQIVFIFFTAHLMFILLFSVRVNDEMRTLPLTRDRNRFTVGKLGELTG